MASVTTLRDQLQTRLATIGGLNAYDDWPDNFFAPGAIVVPIATQHEHTFGPTDLSRFEFEIVVAAPMQGGLKLAQELLDAYTSNTGASSVRAALAGDRTLGGNAHDLFYQPWTRPDVEPINGQEYLGQRLPITVWAA